MANKIRVLLADDHALIREGFRSLLSNSPELEIIGQSENGAELIRDVGALYPDVVLIDISMPVKSGLDALSALVKEHPAMKFIMLTMHGEREYVLRALSTGAQGYLLKNVEKAELERAIRTVYEGGKYYSPAITSVLAESITLSSKNQLSEISPREKEVLTLVAQGRSTKQIADHLDLSTRTVETHRINLLKKLKVSNSAELIKKSIQTGLIQ